MPTDHYFSPQPETRGRRHTFTATLRGHAFTFVTGAGVFSRSHVDAGTRLLIEHMPVHASDRFLDLGCGYGVVGVVAARLAHQGQVTMVDINQRAIELARENLRLNRITNAEAKQGDGFGPVAGEVFGVIALNPPIRAGLPVVHALIERARQHLSPGGRFYLVARTRQGALRLAEKMREVIGNVEEVARGGGYRVFVSRRG
jgi:16S rRNA (guanine1207-N2)-methyltransferase